MPLGSYFLSIWAEKFLEVVSLLFPFICALIAVAFYTLLERKILSYMQRRKGPTKVGFIGLIQPFRDAGKLFCKEFVVPFQANSLVFILSPGLILLIRMSL